MKRKQFQLNQLIVTHNTFFYNITFFYQPSNLITLISTITVETQISYLKIWSENFLFCMYLNSVFWIQFIEFILHTLNLRSSGAGKANYLIWQQVFVKSNNFIWMLGAGQTAPFVLLVYFRFVKLNFNRMFRYYLFAESEECDQLYKKLNSKIFYNYCCCLMQK